MTSRKYIYHDICFYSGVIYIFCIYDYGNCLVITFLELNHNRLNKFDRWNSYNNFITKIHLIEIFSNFHYNCLNKSITAETRYNNFFVMEIITILRSTTLDWTHPVTH
jgi:hypothetical protein